MDWETIGWNSRRLLLLANSVKLGGTISIVTVLVGLLAALWIRNSFMRDRWYRFFFLLFLPIPYYIYALAWMYLVRMLSAFIPGLLRYVMQGFPACLFVESFTYLPFSTLFALLALERVDESRKEMALLYHSPFYVLLRIELPEILPFLAAASGGIFILSVTDFSVPSMFQYNTYSLEIFSVYSRTGNVKNACMMAIPLFLLLLLPVSFLAQGVSRIGFSQPNQRGRCWRYPVGLRGAMRVAFGAEVLQVLLPMGVFCVEMGGINYFKRSFEMIGEELGTSLLVSLLTAFIGILLSAVPAKFLAKQKGIQWWIICLVPLAVPGSLLAMSLLRAVNGSIFHGITQTIFFPAIGCAIHYMPLSLMILAVAIRDLDRSRVEMARIMAVNRWKFYQIIFGMLLSGILQAAGILFFLTLGEEGIMLVLMPPGLEAASVKIYNYLHYGASEYVSGFCLVIVIMIFLVEGIAVGVLRKRWRKYGR
ncbi:MAG: ABC transporter permease [Lachnospiraceae bacterium]